MHVDRDDTGDFVSVVYGTSKQLARGGFFFGAPLLKMNAKSRHRLAALLKGSEMQTVTITSVLNDTEAITVPVRPRTEREGSCLDLIVEMQVQIGCPICVKLSFRTDGTLYFWQTSFGGEANHYAHVAHGIYQSHKPPEPTEAQRQTVANWWAGKNRPLGLQNGVGASLWSWAFGDMTAKAVQDAYLAGEHVFLA